MTHHREAQFRVERLTRNHDVTTFFSGVAAIDIYLQERARQDVARNASMVFVAIDLQEEIIRGYYALSSYSILLDDIPINLKKRLPKYDRIPATLLGRLGVEHKYSETTKPKPRLGEFLLVDAAMRAFEASRTVASALLVIDVLELSAVELASGLRDPLSFYLKYGYVPFVDHPRKLYKPMQTIAAEFEKAIN